MTNILLLNASYEPLRVLPLERAMRLLLRGVVEAAPAAEYLPVRAPSGEWTIPTILRLRRYVHVPRRGARWSKRAVLRRDNWTCIYCGARAGDMRGGRRLNGADFSVEHILPQSRGGENTWTNTACACKACNNRKGDRMPHEAGMKLRWEPKTPRVDYLVASGEIPENWKVYLEL